MKKGVWLSILAVLLSGVIVYSMWYIYRRGELQNNSKDSFIPYNSALVVQINAGVSLPEKVGLAFQSNISDFQKILLYQVASLLEKKGFIAPTSRVLALRKEGKGKIVYLFVGDNSDVLSGKEVFDCLRENMSWRAIIPRKYDQYKIYTLKSGEEEIFCTAEEGKILLSDSELFIEDALKQFEQEAANEGKPTKFQNITKYFSPRAGVNVFLNTDCFSELLPLYIQTNRLFPHLNISSCFKWGALDGELQEEGISLNGFMDYTGLEASYMKTFSGQEPEETNLAGMLPGNASSVMFLNISQLDLYLKNLEEYRRDAGLIGNVRKRKQEYAWAWGKGAEAELKELLQGKFALANMSFNEATGKNEGLIVAEVKSGGLCKNWIEKIVTQRAKQLQQNPGNFYLRYTVDREKTIPYYKSPVEDWAAVYWGYIFEGIPAKYLLVVDNYLVLGSSQKVMGDFIKEYIHGNFIKNTDWFKKAKTKLSAKSNLAYFANVRKMLPYYTYVTKGDWKKYLATHEEELAVFSTLAVQWSNEGEMLYSNLFLSTEEIKQENLPHQVWQTKLEAKVSMKPVPVINHITKEQEIFVQDDQQTIYLLNNSGRILWKLKVDGQINSEVYQVDAFKNGKLQYLFSTPDKLYLVDRNGKYVDRFPLAFEAKCERGIALFDYDQNRNYRIFAPLLNQQVSLYDIKGNLIPDWKGVKTDKEIVSRVYHFRVGNKDYIVLADRYRLYILDRKGKERVRVSDVFDLGEGTEIYLTHKGGKPLLAFANSNEQLNLVDFNGKNQPLKYENLAPGWHLNVANINKDNEDELIFTAGKRLKIYNLSGQEIYSKEIEANSLDFPYVYRFSGNDIRIGLLDRDQQQMLLWNLKTGMSAGFPIPGDSPFSIVFSDNGNFYLFAGVDNGSLIKYKVQR